MRKILALSIIAAAVVGCMPMYDKPAADTSYQIRLDMVSDIPEACRRSPLSTVEACAYLRDEPCVIKMNPDTWEMYIVHEIAHCLGIYTWHMDKPVEGDKYYDPFRCPNDHNLWCIRMQPKT